MANSPRCPFLDHVQEFVIFFNGRLGLSSNVFISKLVLIQELFSNLRKHLISKACVLFSDSAFRSVTHSNSEIWILQEHRV